jgi:hypothetical protein
MGVVADQTYHHPIVLKKKEPPPSAIGGVLPERAGSPLREEKFVLRAFLSSKKQFEIH